jgi:hypothetical protein
MPIFKWEEGRQGGYEKLTIFSSKKLKCDLHLIRLKAFCCVPWHKDPVAAGFEHHRINLDLIRPSKGGVTKIAIHERTLATRPASRLYRFRPDLQYHEVSTVCDPDVRGESLLILSFGWLKKVKPPVSKDSDDLWMYDDCDD